MTQQSAEVITSGGIGGPREPRSWAIPAVVAGAAMIGVVAVPVLITVLGSQPSTPAATAADRPSASASGSTSAAPSAAVVAVPAAAPSRAPRASLALATPVPPNRVHVPTPQPTRSSSAPGTPSVSGDPIAGGRSAAVDPLSGPAGRTVTITGRCVPGTDTRYTAGSPSAAKHPVTADGSFAVREQVATEAAQAHDGAQVPLEVTCLDAGGTVTFRQAFSFQVTAVVALPDQVPGDAGPLGAPQSAPAGSSVSVSGGGFMPGAPVVFGVRNLDSGKAEGTRQVLAGGGGGVSAMLAVPGPASVQIVAAGFDPGGGYRVLVATLATN